MARRKRKTPSQTTSTASPSADESTLSFASLSGRLEFLQQQHKKLLTQIKRRRTELSNLTGQVREVAMEMVAKSSSLYEQLLKIDQEIHNLFDEILTKRRFGKQSKKQIEEVYKTLQLTGRISSRLDPSEHEEMEEDFAPEEEDFHSSNPRNFFGEQEELFAETGAEVKGRASKDLRKLFLKLADKFHPDKVADEETQNHHTEVMKEINLAYKNGDYARLLEIESQSNKEDFRASAQNEQERQLEKEIELLTEQLEQLKTELNQVKSTPEGQMVKAYRSAKREGIDIVGNTLEEGQMEIDILEEVRNFVQDFRDRKITIKDFIKGPASASPVVPEELEELLEAMFGEDLELIMRR
ncbi:MAG: hypothetical protein WA865_08205 [Spirulinaceae cyanobacterium]